MMEMNDLDTEAFATMLSYMEPHPPVTEELDRWGSRYTSEKAHMVLWFGNQNTTGSGSYTRNKPNTSARTAYNRLLAPGAMLWIAEVLGETPERLREAHHAAVEAEKVHWRNRGKGFREVIPFDRIYELCGIPEGWYIDGNILQLIKFDEDGYPVSANDKEFLKVLKKEIR